MAERPTVPAQGNQRPFAAALERLRGTPDGDALAAPTDLREVGVPDVDWSGLDIAAAGKTPISIRLDDDILAFFKEAGPGYQKRINAVLRAYMLHAQRGRER
ncbi:MAG: BrnA antitoxin family protein [Labrys sp. (in: a-proteobacteria)]|jgi:uncharacterized protein (DUF4415 family)